jgi:hypothetical protein
MADVSVYPNPFADYIVIEATTNGNVVIYDLSGKTALDVNVQTGTNRVSTSALAKGVYILKYGLNTVKVIK